MNIFKMDDEQSNEYYNVIMAAAYEKHNSSGGQEVSASTRQSVPTYMSERLTLGSMGSFAMIKDFFGLNEDGVLKQTTCIHTCDT